MTRNDPRSPSRRRSCRPASTRVPVGAPSGLRAAGGVGRLAAGVRVLAALIAAAVLGTSGWGWYLGRVAEANVQRTDAIPTDGNDGAGFAPEAMNLLLVGNDSRASSPRRSSRSSTPARTPAPTPTR